MALVGTCDSACPMSEAASRAPAACEARTGLVKRYSRSAAGQQIAPQDVRPIPLLLETMITLLLHVSECVESPEVCADFVSDRLRAIRQDMIVQQSVSPALFVGLACMLRYHAACGFVLAGARDSSWSPALNDRFMAEILSLGHDMWDRLEVHVHDALQPVRAEFLAFELVLSWPDPTLTKIAFVACHRASCLPAKRVLRATRLWAACNWSGLLQELDAWSTDMEPVVSPERSPSVFLRCAVERYVLVARAALLRTLNAAFLDRRPVSLIEVASLLHMKDTLSGGVAAGGNRSCEKAMLPLEVHEDSDMEPAWFRCARFVAQWRLTVADVSDGSSSPIECNREYLSALVEERHARGPPTRLVVCWNKAEAVDPCSLELHARVALAPTHNPRAVQSLPRDLTWSLWLADAVRSASVGGLPACEA